MIFMFVYVLFMLADLKAIALTVFSLNMFFTYLWVSYNIVKLQTCSSSQSGSIAPMRLSQLSKSLVSRKLLHLENFV